MTTTPRLGLELVDDDEILGYVSVNEATLKLDALTQGTVISRTLTAPPGTPLEGYQYIVAASPTGAWAGHATHLAQYAGATWHFYVPSEGWTLYDQGANQFVIFDGTSWAVGVPGGGAVTSVATDATLIGGPITATGTLWNVAQADTTPAVITVDTWGAALRWAARRAGGTRASPTALAAGDVIFGLTADGRDTAGYSDGPGQPSQATMRIQTVNAWTAGADRSTAFVWRTTPPGSTTEGEVMRLGQGLSVGATTDPGAGVLNAQTGYHVANSGGTTGQVLRSNGTHFLAGSVASADLSDGWTLAHINSSNAFSQPQRLNLNTDIPTPTSFGAGVVTHQIGVTGSNSYLLFETYNSAPGLVGQRTRGTPPYPAGYLPVLLNNNLLRLVGNGYDTTGSGGAYTTAGEIDFQPAANWGANEHAGQISFTTTTPGAGGALTQRLLLMQGLQVMGSSGSPANTLVPPTSGDLGAGRINAAVGYFTNGAGGVTAGSFGTITAITATGGIISQLTGTSDERLKRLRGRFTRGLEALLPLQPVCFTWTEASGLSPDLVQAGLTAQSVQATIPEAVGEETWADGQTWLTLNYNVLVTTLINAVQELHTRLVRLEGDLYG